jgi:[protein]-arginine 3-hydroxylase / protease
LQKCGSSVILLLESCVQKLPNSVRAVEIENLQDFIVSTDSMVDLADEKILAIPYKDVPLFWRRLLTDTSLLKALFQILLIHNSKETIEKIQLLRQICHGLDTAIVVAGAPGHDRRMVIDTILDLSQSQLHQLQDQNETTMESKVSSKRRRLMDGESYPMTLTFPVNTFSTSPSFMEFNNYINSNSADPIVMENIIDHWPALNEHPWHSMPYLLSVAGERLVPVEFGSQYTDSDWSQRMMPFREFVNNYVEVGTGDKNKIAYLAQHDLFHQVPRLEQDIIIPDYCYVTPKITERYERQPSDVITNAWFGPGGTVSPLHHDPYHNLLAQVVGSKYIRLYAPDQSSRLYPHAGMMSNTSQVNVEKIDDDRFPNFRDAKYVECILKAGQVLYIPVSVPTNA